MNTLDAALKALQEMAKPEIYHGDSEHRVYTTSDCVLNILGLVVFGHMRLDFMQWLSQEIDKRNLSIEQGVLIGAGVLDWGDFATA